MAVSKALYRKYRSKKLDDVIGQKHITDILSRAIKQGRISHAYLFTGPRGVGKTSVARILAHEINGLEYDEEATNLDIIEIDAASNNGVEDVRDLREKVQIAPVSAAKKVYIIDEVHMLSKAAFNALLKTLEEPPEHVVFILATTNVEKLPATIISRTQRFSFRPIKIDDAIKHLRYIADQEKINISDDALQLIAARSEGSFRDSISLLDQLSNLAENNADEISTQLIEDMLGLTSNNIVEQLIGAIETHDLNKTIELLNTAYDEGASCSVLTAQLINAVSEQVVKKPQLLTLLDALIGIEKSSQPQIKLLSVLGAAAAPKQSPKTAALSAPIYEVKATVAELEKQATRKKPTESTIKELTEVAEATEILEDTKLKKTNVEQPTVKSKKSANIKDFNFAQLVEYTKQNYIAIYSVLSKCGYEINGNVLTLYSINNFYKKKLDDPKYRPLLFNSLEELGVYGLDIHTIPTAIPPKDSQAAEIAAIMGGGVEVSLDAA